jgi:DNA-binding FadR family transcriptional regulator
LADDAASYARFDWELQRLMAKSSGNRILPLMFNDFEMLHLRIGGGYFSDPEVRRETDDYYQRLADAVRADGNRVRAIVTEAMDRSEQILTAGLERST